MNDTVMEYVSTSVSKLYNKSRKEIQKEMMRFQQEVQNCMQKEKGSQEAKNQVDKSSPASLEQQLIELKLYVEESEKRHQTRVGQMQRLLNAKQKLVASQEQQVRRLSARVHELEARLPAEAVESEESEVESECESESNFDSHDESESDSEFDSESDSEEEEEPVQENARKTSAKKMWNKKVTVSGQESFRQNKAVLVESESESEEEQEDPVQESFRKKTANNMWAKITVNSQQKSRQKNVLSSLAA